MYDQDYSRMLKDCDRRIANEFEGLRAAANSVGYSALQAARDYQARDSRDAASTKTMRTLFPLIISLVGFLIFTISWFASIVLVIFGIWLSSALRKKAVAEQRQIEQQNAASVQTITYQYNNLVNVLNDTKKI